MHLGLAAMYNTPGTPSQEDQEKVAEAELFAKLAADNGISLEDMSEEQIQHLYSETFGKVASEEEDKGALKNIKKLEKHEEKEVEEDEEKKAAADAEFAVQQEWQSKVAEADYLGRLMAHAYVAELGNIKEAGKVDGAAKAVGKHLENLGKKTVKTVGRTGGGEGAMKPSHAKGVGAGVYGAGAAAAGGAALAASKKKQSSAIDELALEAACKLAQEAGFDVEEAASLVTAVHTLGLGASEKLAAAQDTDGAVQIRALEYLEAAGYPINWEV